ncbi:MAG: 4-diphosphocytidyl-2C-methyl-D-erythritol synthase [Phycisphaerales bacterium]|nr:4-diphosphocytidyl-2C-methyl-D-erythritol synthase [Phycisphaerales bacterium]
MGRPKQLLTIDGQSLLSRAVANAEAVGCDPIVVVLGRDGEQCRAQIGERATAIQNDRWESGMGSSLRAGANALPATTRQALILLCDQPSVSVDTLNRLIDAFEKTHPAACVAAYAGTLGPPVIVDEATLQRLRSWPDSQGAKALWTGGEIRVESVPCPEASADIDTPDDYAQAVQSKQRPISE